MRPLAESASSHPISKSLQKAYGKEIDRSRVEDIREISGNGVIARVDGVEVAAGNDKLMERLGVPYKNCHSVGTIIHMALDGKICRTYRDLGCGEAPFPGGHTGAEGFRSPQNCHAHRDARKVAEQVAGELDIDEVYSELLPADKVEKVEELLKNRSEKEKLAFVGDGINDAPVLGRADIGIAMGAMGSDAAIEAADVVLMDDDPMKIAKSHPHLPQVPADRVPEYRVRHRNQADLPGAGSGRHRQYVACHLRRCGRDDSGRAECDTGFVREEAVKIFDRRKYKTPCLRRKNHSQGFFRKLAGHHFPISSHPIGVPFLIAQAAFFPRISS